MKIVFTNHAKYRISERKISVSDIKETIKNSEVKNIDAYGMIVAKKKLGKRSLEVIYCIKNNNFIVVTAYYEN